MQYPVRLCLALFVLAAFAGRAQAEEADGFDRELWLTTGFLSHHTQHAQKYNQHNDGLGAEWRFAEDWQLNAGHYRNSVRHGSTYAQAAWMPVIARAGEDWRVRAGASVGVIDGYRKVRHGGYFATFVPALSVEKGRFGINTLYIPSVGKRVDGAFAVQLKFRMS